MKRRLGALAVLVVAALAIGAGWYVWHRHNQVDLPAIDPSGLDPEVAAAIDAARDGVRKAPHAALAWGELGKVLAAHQYEEEADRCFAEAERLDPKEGRWPYFRGLSLTFHDSNAAIADYQRAVQRAGSVEPFRLRLAEALLAQDRLNEAEEQFRVLLESSQPPPRALLGMGRLLYQRGDLDGARKYLQQAASDPLTQKAAHTLRAELEQRAGVTAVAARESEVAAALPDDPDWADPYLDEILRLRAARADRLQYAMDLLHQGRTEEANERLRELVERFPDWDQAWLTYGRFLLENGASPSAEQALRTAVRLAPESVTAHFHLGVALAQRDDYVGAESCFRQTIRFKRDYALGYFNLGQCLKHENKRAEAVTMFREAVRCKPDYAAAHIALGELLGEDHRSEALEHVRLALAVKPDDAEAKKLLQRLERP